MGRRNLLLCFDAFGTLFKPRRPIPEQYAAVARQCGLDGFGIKQLETSFKAAFSEEIKTHPNYGKANGMGAEKWWANVICKTFQPLAEPGRAIPKDLVPKLLHRFSSNEGYTLAPGIDSLLRTLKQQSNTTNDQPQVIVGVITNSDDRVPGILSSLGLRVSPLRFGSNMDTPSKPIGTQQLDIDFHCMSYDVGFAKPDRRIFDAAEAMAKNLIATQDGAYSGQDSGGAKADESWLKLYVGDEFEKDAKAACAAGWNSVLVGSGVDIGGQESLLDLEQCRTSALDRVFQQESSPLMIRAESTQALLEWLIKQYVESG